MIKAYRILSCEEDADYRYRLDVETVSCSSKEITIVQLNPSTADARNSDPTIGKVSCWANEHAFGRVTFLNLFSIRTPHSDELIGKPYETLFGARNNDVTEMALTASDRIIFAWGRLNPALSADFKQRMEFLKPLLAHKPVYAVGKPVAKIFPRHGRMWNGENRNLRPFMWPD